MRIGNRIGQELLKFMYLKRPRRVRARDRNIRLFLAGSALLALFLAGCAVFRVPEEPATPTPINPVWSAEALQEHLRFLNRSDVAGRTTGTQGYARAAAYVAARMEEFGLQPALEGDYRIIYGVSINYPVSGQLRITGPADSLDFLPGLDFLPDGRSDSGSVAISRFMVAGTDTDPGTSPAQNFGIIVPPGHTVNLGAWNRAGAKLALIVDELYPRIERMPVKGMLVVQITPDAMREVLRIGQTALEYYLADRRGEIISLGRAVQARVNTTYQPQAGAINMMGYLSGKHPVRREELVIVCADLDAVGQYAGVTTMDFRNFGTSTASLLEVARNMGYITRRWQLPERSVMLAVWSGSRIGNAGLRYFLENPTWALDKITSVVYIGLSKDEERQIRDLLDAHAIELVAIAPPEDPLHPEHVLLLPDPMVRRIARTQGRRFDPIPEPDMSQLIDSAVVRAIDLAGDAYESTMMEATHSAPFMPTHEDSLRIPATEVAN